MNTSICLVLLLCIYAVSFSECRPHHGDDAYTPVIRFLKELRRARKYGSSGASALPIKDQSESSGQSSNVEAIRDADSIRVGVGGGVSEDAKRDTNLQLEQTLQQISSQLPTQAPYPIERVNTGLRTLLGGVNSGSLADILRGSFTFTRNENVRSVANTVIDSIFGGKAADSVNAPTN